MTYGIRYYTSKDLCNWDDRGLLISPSSDLHEPLHPTYCIDRPHIIFCEKAGKNGQILVVDPANGAAARNCGRCRSL